MVSNFNRPVSNRYGVLVFWSAVVSTVYFLTMSWLGGLRAAYPLIGVLIELLTIPFLLVALACFVLSCISWARARFKFFSLAFCTLLVLSGLVLFLTFAS